MKIDFSIKDYTIIFLHSEFSLINQLFFCPFSYSQLLFFHSPSLELLLLSLDENLGQASWFELLLLLTVADHLEFLVLMKTISIKVEVGWKLARTIKEYGEFFVRQKLQQKGKCWNYIKHNFPETSMNLFILSFFLSD